MLRTRITLIVTLSFVILAVGLVLESARQQAAVEARQAAAVISGDRAAWEALVAVEVQQLEGLATTLTRDEGLVLAVANAEPANIAATLSRLLGPGTPLASSDLGAEVMGPEGNRLYGSDTHGIGGGVFGPWLTRTLGNTTQVESGFLTPPGERPVIAAVSPLYGRRGLTGYVALYTSPEPVLARLGRSIGAEALLLTDAPAAQGNGADPRSAPSLGLQPEEDGRRVIQVRIPLLDRADRSAGTLVTLRDATASYRKERTVRNLNYGAILCVLLLLVGLLNWYLRTAFGR